MFNQTLDIASNKAISQSDNGKLYRVDTSGGDVTITLPATSVVGEPFIVSIAKKTGDINQVVIVPSGEDTVNGSTIYTLNAQFAMSTFLTDLQTKDWFAQGAGVAASNPFVNAFTSNGTDKTFVLANEPGNKNNTNVYVGGLYWPKSEYSIAGKVITLSAAVPSGTLVEVDYGSVLGIGVPADGTVSTNKLIDTSITTQKIVDGAITGDKLAVDSVGTSNIMDGVISTAKLANGSVTNDKLANGDANTFLGYDSNGSPVNYVYVKPFRNLLFNGDMSVAQRGTSFTTINNQSIYTLDRWQVSRGATNITAQQNTPSNPPAGIVKSLLVTRNAGDTSNAIIAIGQCLDVATCKPYAGKTITLSFYANCGANYSSVSNCLSVYLTCGTDATDKNPFAVAYTNTTNAISATTVLTTGWQRFTFTGTIPSNVTQFTFLAQYAPTGNAGAADWLQIANVQLEEGNVATPFEQLPFDVNLQRCLRYYETGHVMSWAYWGNAVGMPISAHAFFHVRKRVIPTITITNITASNCSSSATLNSVTVDGFNDMHTASTGGGCQWVDSWAANAEM